MRYLITGYSGQLGYDIYKELIRRGVSKDDILTPTSKELDLTDKESVLREVCAFKPDVIFHCAAYTKVDNAEEETLKCMKVNGIGTHNMAKAADMVDAKIISISSDYVFDGTKEKPYFTDDATNALNVYGESKEYAEGWTLMAKKGFVVRTSWVFGINGNNFVKTMINLGQKYKALNVVNDQIGSPTYTPDLASFLVDLSNTEQYGIHHATNEGYTSWADFAKFIMEYTGSDTIINGVSTEEYYKDNTKKIAERPKNSRLSKEKIDEIGLSRLPMWTDATKRYIDEYYKSLEKPKTLVK